MPEGTDEGSWTSDDGWIEIPPGTAVHDGANRIALVAVTVGVVDSYSVIDPHEEEPGRPAGIEVNAPMVTLDMHGHLHPPWIELCVPLDAPFLMTRDATTTLIDSLKEAVAKLDALPAPDVDRG